MGWTTPKQTSLMLMMGPVHCDLVATLVALSCMTRCMAWREILPGCHVLIRRIECHGGVEEL
jgi:hypothetical protein